MTMKHRYVAVWQNNINAVELMLSLQNNGMKENKNYNMNHNKPTDEQLKRALAKMLPDTLTFYTNPSTTHSTLFWNKTDPRFVESVKDTELLYLAHQIEERVEIGHDGSDADEYQQCLWYIVNLNVPFTEHEMMDVLYLHRLLHATWQQRVIALVQVLGVEIL